MKTIALAFIGLVLFAAEPKPKPPTVEELQAQVKQLQKQVAEWQGYAAQVRAYDQKQIIAMQGAFQGGVNACLGQPPQEPASPVPQAAPAK